VRRSSCGTREPSALLQRGAVGLGCALAIAACGASLTATAQIRSNFARLLAAFKTHDANTVCELIFPFGEHQPAGALAKQLKLLEKQYEAAKYHQYLDRCAPAFARNRRDFTDYDRLFAGLSIGTISVHGDSARLTLLTPSGEPVPAEFVRAAGEWRLVERVQ
jgi:hypothetical protein